MESKPPVPARTYVSRAVNILAMSGMVLRYQSRFGNSYYLGWPGRKALLRVSDHSGRGRGNDQAEIATRLTITPESSLSEESFHRKLAFAFGHYMLKSATPGPNAPCGELLEIDLDAE